VVVTVKMTIGGDGKDKAQAAPSAAPAIDPKPAVRVDAGAAKAKVEEVTIKFISKPIDGVEVYDGDRLIGETPFEQRYPKLDKDIKVIGEKDGYDFSTATFNPFFVDKPVVIRVKQAKTGKGKRLHGGGAKKTPAGDAAGTPKGPKNDDLPDSPYNTNP
jgi:hypothetical protein